MTRWERQCSAVFGLLTARLAQLAMGAGVLALVVGLALQRGSRDNVTCVVVAFERP